MKTKHPKFGDRVCWYRMADVNGKPQLADVVGVMIDPREGPVLSLIVLQGDRPNASVTGARHSSSPVLKERPRGANIAKESGCWETLVEYEDRVAGEQLRLEVQRAQEEKDRQEEMRLRAEQVAKKEQLQTA